MTAVRWHAAALPVALVVAGCTEGAPGPPGVPVEDHREAVRTTSVEGARVVNSGPAERLVVYDPAASGRMTLLFMGGRAATPLDDGGSAWADQDGARLIRFGRSGQVEEVLGGEPADVPPPTGPAFVAVQDGDLLAVEADGRAVRFSGGTVAEWVTPRVPAAPVGGARGVMAATRTVLDIRLAPLEPDAPLLWLIEGADVRPVGRITAPGQAMLGPVVNAGWVASTPDGGAYFASAVRPELRRYARDGSLRWVSTWSHDGVVDPSFGVTDGSLTPVFRLVQQAVAVGPDERVYVLATTGAKGAADRLLVFEPDGSLLRAAPVDPSAALFVGPGGHVFATDPTSALSRARNEATRTRLASFDLPALDGDGRVRLADYEGKVVVVNFWASWCHPCRREMPALEELHRSLDPDRAVVIGLNEDVAPRDGIDFLEELGGVSYPVAEGRGRLRERYGYRGLPYTVVLDGEGRIAKTFYGFGESVEPVGEAVRAELRRGA